jgi:RNA polymerase sigma-70 factor (TIGR02943 family)
MKIEQLVENYSKDLLYRAKYMVNDMEIAKDLVQETFIAAFESMEKFSGQSQAKTWLFGILHHKIQDQYRKKYRASELNEKLQNEVQDVYFDDSLTWKSQKSPANWSALPVHLLDNPDFSDIFDSCIENLPGTWSQVIKFKVLKHELKDDFMPLKDLSESNIWQIIHRAKLKLRNCLETHGFSKEQL